MTWSQKTDFSESRKPFQIGHQIAAFSVTQIKTAFFVSSENSHPTSFPDPVRIFAFPSRIVRSMKVQRAEWIVGKIEQAGTNYRCLSALLLDKSIGLEHRIPLSTRASTLARESSVRSSCSHSGAPSNLSRESSNAPHGLVDGCVRS